jgi:hypothetical protein
MEGFQSQTEQHTKRWAVCGATYGAADSATELRAHNESDESVRLWEYIDGGAEARQAGIA